MFPLAFNWLNTSRSLTGPVLFALASSSVVAAIGTLAGKAVAGGILGFVLAVAFMAAIVLFVGMC